MRGASVLVVVSLALVLGVVFQGQGHVEGLVCTKEYKEDGCNKTISDLFTVDMFEAMFNHREDTASHAQGFWTYDSFMAAAKVYEPLGFGSVGGDVVQKRELAAFFAHVAHETSCKWKCWVIPAGLAVVMRDDNVVGGGPVSPLPSHLFSTFLQALHFLSYFSSWVFFPFLYLI